MEISLEVKAVRHSTGPKVTARLTFKNKTSDPIQIARFLMGQGEAPTNSYFEVFSGDTEVDYVGASELNESRKNVEFVTVAAGEEAVGTFDLSEGYAWLGRPAEYSIRYETFNHLSVSKIQLQSREVKVRF